MSLKPFELEQLGRELTRELDGAVVQKVYAPTPARLYVELRIPGRSVLVLFCAEPRVARVSAVEERPPNPPIPPGWQGPLRAHLTGARLREVEVLTTRRTLVARFTRDEKPLALVLEVGSAPGLALLGPEARILAISHPFRPGHRLGSPWAPPDEAPVKESPSRLASDHVHLRLAHGAEALFTGQEQQAWTDARRAPLEAKLKKLARTREKVRVDGERTGQALELKREGELLAQNLYRVQRGMGSVVLTEYLEDGSTREVTVKLDPQKKPQAEVEHRFHQYRRLLRGADMARQRLVVLDAEKAALEAQLAALAAEVPSLPEPGATVKRAPAQGPLAPYREYLGTGGQRIWVGRGSQHNDALTFKVARPWHAWLHVRGMPGAHVVVPLEKTQELSSDVLVDAAHLALHHSDARGEPRAEVSATQVKFVRKGKGDAPGAVTYTREKTLMLRVEPERLARLLATEVTPAA